MKVGIAKAGPHFYESIASYYNYSFTPVLIKLNDESFHRFTIIYDETGYCYVDMTNVNCVKYLFDEKNCQNILMM